MMGILKQVAKTEVQPQKVRQQVQQAKETIPTGAPLISQVSLSSRTGDSLEDHLQMVRLARAQPSQAGALLQLQRRYGNHYVQRLVKLAMKREGAGDVSPEVEDAIQRARGSGQALDSRIQAQMEAAFGTSFRDVRIHTGPEADELNQAVNARAFTIGQDIFFSAGEYQPDSSSGRELLAHELTHVVQQGGGVRPKMAVSQPVDESELEADRTAKAVLKNEAESSPVRTASGTLNRSKPLISRQNKPSTSVPVEIIVVPKTYGRVQDIVEDTFNKIQGIYINYAGALQNFETIVQNSSKEEAAPKEAGLIVLEEVSKFVAEKTVDYILDLAPGAKYIKQAQSLGKKILEEIEKEEKRSAKATESNELANFIVDLRNTITTDHSDILAAEKDISTRIQYDYDRLNPSAQKVYREQLELKNALVERARNTIFSVTSLFERITTAWINATKAPGKPFPAQIEITLDKNWQVTKAFINAPRGSRLAERLLRNHSGFVDLTDFDVPKYVTWLPRSDEQYAGLAVCYATVDARGKVTTIGANIYGQNYVQQFVELLATRPISKTVKLTGVKTD